MNSRAMVGLVSLALLLSSFGNATPESGLSDSAAKDIIEKAWNPSVSSIRLGALVVVSGMSAMAEGNDPTDLKKGVISPRVHSAYQALAKLGVIAIGVDREFESFKAGKQFSWSQYGEMIGGTGSKIVVTPSPKGDSLMATLPKQFLLDRTKANAEAPATKSTPAAPRPTGWLYLPLGSFRVTRMQE